jgi:diguanylate cyclase (GGDEF)-like protein
MYIPRSLVGLGAALLFVASRQLLQASMATLRRGMHIRGTQIADPGYWAVELVLASMGLVLALLWPRDHWLAALSVLPVLLTYQGLRVPQLEKEARTDGKTGLFNARYFGTLFSREIERAFRLERPLAFIMCDMDYLRNVNNLHGHAAGDLVISGLASILKREIRETDIAARFGGEEYIVLAPGLALAKAMALAERLRRAVERAEFSVPTSADPIRVTMSIGVAVFPYAGVSETTLQHAADVAVYQAKHDGRNKVVSADQVRAEMWEEYGRQGAGPEVEDSARGSTRNTSHPAARGLVPWAYRLRRGGEQSALEASSAEADLSRPDVPCGAECDPAEQQDAPLSAGRHVATGRCLPPGGAAR